MRGSDSIEVDGSYRLKQVTLVENTARLVGARLKKADELKAYPTTYRERRPPRL